MKLFMVINVSEKHKHKKRTKLLKTDFKANIANSLELGWKREDIFVISNVKMEYKGVETIIAPLNDFCLTGSKMFGLKWFLENNSFDPDEVIWASDTDCWQDTWFDCPDFKDVGACHYSRPKFNGGSVFWRPRAIDIINEIIEILEKEKLKKEEPTLNRVFKSHKYVNRITVLNYTYNVGCSGYYERYTKSDKPVRVCHFHPYNRIAWETHCLDRNGMEIKGISDRLEKLIRKYYKGIAEVISEEGGIRRGQKKAERIRRGIEI